MDGGEGVRTVSHADCDVDRLLDDLLRAALGQHLNTGATLAASDDERATALAVEQDGEVHLVDEVHLLGHQQLVHRLALGACDAHRCISSVTPLRQVPAQKVRAALTCAPRSGLPLV